MNRDDADWTSDVSGSAISRHRRPQSHLRCSAWFRYFHANVTGRGAALNRGVATAWGKAQVAICGQPNLNRVSALVNIVTAAAERLGQKR